MENVFEFVEPNNIEDSINFLNIIQISLNAFLIREKEDDYTLASAIAMISSDGFKKLGKHIKHKETGFLLNEMENVNIRLVIQAIACVSNYLTDFEIPDAFEDFIGGISKASFEKLIADLTNIGINAIDQYERRAKGNNTTAFKEMFLDALIGRGE